MDALKRHHEGRQHLANAILYWLKRSSLSHGQMAAIAAWYSDDDDLLHTSQISKLRNGGLKTPFLKCFEGLEAANLAMAGWHQEGPQVMCRRHGPLPREVTADEMSQTIWLPDPVTGKPLDFCGFTQVFIGRIKLPGITALEVSSGEARAISEVIGAELDAWLAAQGGLRNGWPPFERELAAHGVPVESIAQLRAVVVGSGAYDPEQLQAELPHVVSALNLATAAPRTQDEWVLALRRRADEALGGGLTTPPAGSGPDPGRITADVR